MLYVAPVGEPAIGPVAYMHRPSALNDPFAPLAHHWTDATHITYGVVSAGLFTKHVKLEGTLFNGREPDEDRYDFDFHSLDSYGARISVNPTPHWGLSASYGYLQQPEALHPDENQHRVGASILHTVRLGRQGEWASALIYGANKHVLPAGAGLLGNGQRSGAHRRAGVHDVAQVAIVRSRRVAHDGVDARRCRDRKLFRRAEPRRRFGLAVALDFQRADDFR